MEKFGHWVVDGPPHNQIVWSGPETRICFLAHSAGIDDERDIAIGRLIAAAPELVEALKEARVALVYAERGSDADDGAKYLATLAKIDAALSRAGVTS